MMGWLLKPRAFKSTGIILKVNLLIIFMATFTLAFSPSMVQAQEHELLEPIFVLLSPTHNNLLEMDRIQTLIKTNGGHITHTFPYQAIIAKVPTSIIQQLSAQPSVAGVYTEAVELAMIDVYGSNVRRYAAVWNNLIISQQTPASDMSLQAAEHPDEPHDDAFIAPDLSQGNDLDLVSASSVTPGYYQTSEYMAGSVAVGIVLVESDGSVDPSTEDWTEDEKQLVFSKIVAALNWWADLETKASLSFVYDDHFSNPLPSGVEPIIRPRKDQQYWIADAMGALGYNAPSYITRVRDYNNNLRDIYKTDWAFTVFVVDSSNDFDNRFSDGYFAYAYLGGPFMVMTYGNNGYGPYNMDAVAAHEIGHIFHALDQYYSASKPCTLRSGYLDIENQNSQYGTCISNVTSIMRGDILPFVIKAIDAYAAGQLGWRDSDGDNIFDPLDTELPVSIETISQQDNSITVNGTANIVPYPSPTHTSVTINTLTGVQYRFDVGAWQPAIADDGAFDTTAENYHFTATSLPPGLHTLDIAALDSAGNMSEVYASETITILDPVDGGLNTELYQPDGALTANTGSTLNGVAYHLQGGIVTRVEYRMDNGPWQPAIAEDGAFDSNYESFTLPIDIDDLEPGTYLVEARAIDANGYTEINFASEEISMAELSTIFLPILINGM